MTAAPSKKTALDTSQKTAQQLAAQQLVSQVDELGDIDKQLAPLRALISRETALRAAIRSRFEDAPANETCEAAGTRYVVELGWRGVERSIDYPKLIKAIGLKAFSLIAKVTLKVLDDKVPCAIAFDVVTSANTGFRSFKITERGALSVGKSGTP